MNDHYCKSTDHVYTEIFILPTGGQASTVAHHNSTEQLVN